MLGIAPPASAEQVKQAYRDLVLVWHPDRFAANPRLQKIAEARLREINDAFRALRNGVAIDAGRTVYRHRSAEWPARERSTNRQASPVGPLPWMRWKTLWSARMCHQVLHLRRIRIIPWVPAVAVVGLFCAAALWIIDRIPILPMPFGNPEPSPSLRLRSAANDLAASARGFAITVPLGPAQDGGTQAKPGSLPQRLQGAKPTRSARKTFALILDMENGTELIAAAGQRGVGIIRVANRAKLDAAVALLLAPVKAHSSPFRCVYVKAESEIAISGIPPGVYVVEAQLGRSWMQKVFAFSDQRSSTGPLGPFSFLQIENEGGTVCGHYQVAHYAKGIQGQEYNIILQPQQSEGVSARPPVSKRRK